MSVNVQQVEQLNQKAQQLNSQRQKLIGMKESAREAYDKAVFAYQQKYGVQLDDTNLQSEYNEVSQKLNQDFEALNNLVLSIESGEYKQQTEHTPIEQTQVNAQPTQSTQTQQAPQTQFGGGESKPTQEHQNKTVSPEFLAQASMQAQNQPTPQQVFGQQGFNPEPTQQPTAQPTTPAQPTGQSTGQTKDEDVSEQSFTPNGWGTPNKDLNSNFDSIMSGQQGAKFD